MKKIMSLKDEFPLVSLYVENTKSLKLAARIVVSETVNTLPHIFFALDHTASFTEQLKIRYVSVEETQMFL